MGHPIQTHPCTPLSDTLTLRKALLLCSPNANFATTPGSRSGTPGDIFIAGNDSQSEPVDYFNFKQAIFPVACSNSGSNSALRSKPWLGSYFSPQITPIVMKRLTRPSSPAISPPFVPQLLPTPEEGPFPHSAYDSGSTLLPSPIPDWERGVIPIDIKVYFWQCGELFKLRLTPEICLADFIIEAARKMPYGWNSVFAPNPGVEIGDILSTDPSTLSEISSEIEWRNWLQRSLGRRRRLLWAL